MKYIFTILIILSFFKSDGQTEIGKGKTIINGSLIIKDSITIGNVKRSAITPDSVLYLSQNGTMYKVKLPSSGGSSITHSVHLLEEKQFYTATTYPAFPVYELKNSIHHSWWKEGIGHAGTGVIKHAYSIDGKNWKIDTVQSSGAGYHSSGFGNNDRMITIYNSPEDSLNLYVRYRDLNSSSWTTAPLQNQFAFQGQRIIPFGKIRQINGDTLITCVYSINNKTSAILSYDNGITWRAKYIDTTYNLNEAEFMALPNGVIGAVIRPLESQGGGTTTIPRLYKSLNRGQTWVRAGSFIGKLAEAEQTYPGCMSFFRGKVWISFGYRGGYNGGSIRYFECPQEVFSDSTLIPIGKSYLRPYFSGISGNLDFGYLSTSPDTVNDQLNGVYYDYTAGEGGIMYFTGVSTTVLTKQNYAVFNSGSFSVPANGVTLFKKKGWNMLMDGNNYQDKDTLGAITAPESGFYSVQIRAQWQASANGTSRYIVWYNDGRLVNSSTGNPYSRQDIATYTFQPSTVNRYSDNTISFIGYMPKGNFFTFRFDSDASTSQQVNAFITIKKIN